MQHRIKAQNIKCEGCVAAIQEALQMIPGVSAVTVEKREGWVTVNAADAVRRSELTKALQTAGYPEQASAAGFFKKLFS